MSVHLFGVRHHGIGSARSLLHALEQLQPDCILIEGPPDADHLIPLAAHEEMQPPVALLVYDPDQPNHAAWYPFAVFSPEWQALRFGVATGADVRFMDLPHKYRLGLRFDDRDTLPETEPDAEMVSDEQAQMLFDPIGMLARFAGETDGESWWGRVVEESDNPVEIFTVIHEAMTILRQNAPSRDAATQREESLREAWMRTTIRAALKQHERVAVICGAWHTPALVDLKETKSADSALLKGLPSVKTMATFAPWTYSRLMLASGYGAGIVSPGWYHHLWETDASEALARWLSRVAMVLRDEGMLASTAQVIDSLRLAQMLAVMRGHQVGLDELNEASVAVLCAGRHEPLALIQKQLIIGSRLGSVPPEAPAVPLRRDLSALQKSLRLKMSPDETVLDLDLRQPNDLARSILFHRLNLLNIPWASSTRATVRGKGTFHEYWALKWLPELDIRVIEASVWGNTVAGAALAFVKHHADNLKQLSAITVLLKQTILGDLREGVEAVVGALQNLASVTHDSAELMDAVPPLVDTLRYGDVRKTDSQLIAPVMESLVIRVCIGLVGAASHLDDDAARTVYERLVKLNSALQLAQDQALLARWHDALGGLCKSEAVHPLLSGAAMQLLFRVEKLAASDVALAMRRNFSVGRAPEYAMHWLEGFLSGMEHILLRDSQLLGLVDAWVVSLTMEQFDDMLPLLRRTFATFSAPVRRSLSELIGQGRRQVEVDNIDETRAARVVPIMRQILGMG